MDKSQASKKQWRFPISTERLLARKMNEIAKEIHSAMMQQTGRMTFDATDEQIAVAEDAIEKIAERLVTDLNRSMPGFFSQVHQYNTQQFLAMARSTGGTDNRYIQTLNLLGVTNMTSEMTSLRKIWLSQTRKSLQKFANDIINDWSSTVTAAAISNPGTQITIDKVQEASKKYTAWAVNRAGGIIQSLNVALTRHHMKQAGVKNYVWRGRMDERERASHVRLEGKVREYGSIPFPGEPYGCRCWPVPVW